MLAKVLSDRTEEIQPAPPSFTATLNPEPSTFTDTFFFTDGDGNPVANLILIEGSSQEISITLVGTTFSSSPIVWELHPADIPEPTVSGNTLTFTVPRPEHRLSPWAFRIVADTPDVQAIRSQTIFLTRAVSPEPESDQIEYHTSDGRFTLSGQTGGSEPTFLINAGLPGEGSTFSINITSVPSGTSIVFAEPPVVWSSGNAPDWITVSRSTSNPQNMTMTISSGGGQAIGFQFAVQITPSGSTTPITVLSPDPILINATIGDG